MKVKLWRSGRGAQGSLHPVLAGALALLAAASAWGQAPAAGGRADEQQTTRELTVRPAPPPRPALRWQFLPTLMERTPGNAATYYYRAVLLLASSGDAREGWKEYNEHEEEWLSNDPQQYPREAVRQWLSGWQSALEQLRIASRREYCDWELRTQDIRGMKLISFMLPEFQEMRNLARIIRLQAHLERMEGRTDAAFETLSLGYRLGLDVSRSGTLITWLIGIAITSNMNEELLGLIEQGQDNYYWALAVLYTELPNARHSLERERNLPYEILPVLQRPATAQRSPDEWRRLFAQSLAEFQSFHIIATGKPVTPGNLDEWMAAAMVMLSYPYAKQRLLDQGWDRTKVEAMPAAQVVAIDAATLVDQMYDEMLAAFYLPYRHGIHRLQTLQRQLETQRHLRWDATAPLVPLVGLLMPAFSSVLTARTRLEHQVVMLQAIEALRMHAAQTGRWPERLEEVTVVPVPLDPVNDAPFRYRREGDTAILEPSEGIQLPPGHVRRYVLRLKRD